MFKIDNREAMIAKIDNLTLMDDIFLSVVFKDRECSEYLIHTILNKNLNIESVGTQYEIRNLVGRSVRLDIFAKDENNKPYDVDVENSNKGATPNRLRYYSSLVDMNSLKVGKDFDELPEAYVIFITKEDVLKGNKLIYHVERTILETGELLNDGAHIIYVNSAKPDNTPLGRLMHDFHCKKADDMYSPILAKRVRYFKESKEGVDTMCTVMQELVDEVTKRKAIETVRQTHLKGYNVDIIYDFVRSDLTFDEVKAICEEDDENKSSSSLSSQYTHNFT